MLTTPTRAPRSRTTPTSLHRSVPQHAARACDWLARAAEVAVARHAHTEALDLWRQVLADAPPDSVTTALARCGEAAALLRLARTAEARESIDGAVRLARALERWDVVATGAAILNGAGVWSWREHGVKDDAFIAILTEAAEHVDDDAAKRQAAGNPAGGVLLRLGQLGR